MKSKIKEMDNREQGDTLQKGRRLDGRRAEEGNRMNKILRCILCMYQLLTEHVIIMYLKHVLIKYPKLEKRKMLLQKNSSAHPPVNSSRPCFFFFFFF